MVKYLMKLYRMGLEADFYCIMSPKVLTKNGFSFIIYCIDRIRWAELN